jgi:periplasmic divalent cation tolerance protein
MLASALVRSLWGAIRYLMSTETLLVLCTCPDKEVAETIASQLVEGGLAACVNRIADITSVYMWQSELESAAEELLLIKSTTAAWDELQQTISRLHPYELPEIIAVPITAGSDAYLNWIRESTRS